MVDYPGHLARMEDAREDGHVRKFTWQELSKLNQRHNAHVAVRGKVRAVAAQMLPFTILHLSGFL